MLQLAAVLIALGPTAGVMALQPLELVPAESLLCWLGQPLPDTQPVGEGPSTLQTLVELGTRLAGSAGAKLDGKLQVTIRATEMLSLAVRYPHALSLIDVSAKPKAGDPAGVEVDRLRFALIVRNEGHNEPFLRIVQKVVNEQTDSGKATLERKRYGTWTYQELRDDRLPAWSVIAWGALDGHFVLTVGPDVWPLVAKTAAGDTPALSADPWYAAARLRRVDEALIEIFVDVRAMRARVDPLVGGRASAFFRAWDAQSLVKAHWSLGLEERALFCVAHFLTGETTVERMYADPQNRDPRLLPAVPESARYAIYRLPLDRFVRRLSQSLVAVQNWKLRRNIQEVWSGLQRRPDFDIERRFLDRLGSHVVLHNVPPHPLRLPIAVTTLIEIRDGADDVRATVDAICQAYQDAMDKAAAEGRGTLPWSFHRDSDGMWHVRFGPLAGPAWIVTERFIVLSWSPTALRTVLSQLDGQTGRAAER
jgi:hypothetical protein